MAVGLDDGPTSRACGGSTAVLSTPSTVAIRHPYLTDAVPVGATNVIASAYFSVATKTPSTLSGRISLGERAAFGVLVLPVADIPVGEAVDCGFALVAAEGSRPASASEFCSVDPGAHATMPASDNATIAALLACDARTISSPFWSHYGDTLLKP